MPYGKENKCNRKNFDLAIAMMKFLAPGSKFEIRDIYLDYGANMMWETIVAGTTRGTEYQMLSPRDWDRLDAANSVEEIGGLVAELIGRQKSLL